MKNVKSMALGAEAIPLQAPLVVVQIPSPYGNI